MTLTAAIIFRGIASLSVVTLFYIAAFSSVSRMSVGQVANGNGRNPSTTTTPTTTTSSVEETNHQYSTGVIEIPDNGKKLLILHVGPPKTGTTSFQYALQHMNNRSLNHDGYQYFGRTIRLCEEDEFTSGLEDEMCYRFTQHVFPGVATCIRKNILQKDGDDESRSSSPAILEECWKTSKKELENFHEDGKIMIASEEVLHDKNPFVPAGLRDEWKVVTVVSYRRLWQWITSIYFQEYRLFRYMGSLRWDTCTPATTPPSLATFIRGALLDGPSRAPLQKWTEEVAKRYNRRSPSFLWKNNNTKRVMEVEQHDPVHILNVHASQSPLEEFVCNMLPNATTACQEAKEAGGRTMDEMSSVLSNPSNLFMIDYDVIGCTAVQEGLVVDSKYHRLKLFKAVRAFREQMELNNDHQSTTTSLDLLPRRCLDNATLEYLWDESIRLEKELVPKYFHEADQERHRQDFLTAVAKNKFCSVDVSAVLKDERWLDFFANLEAEAS